MRSQLECFAAAHLVPLIKCFVLHLNADLPHPHLKCLISSETDICSFHDCMVTVHFSIVHKLRVPEWGNTFAWVLHTELSSLLFCSRSLSWWISFLASKHHQKEVWNAAFRCLILRSKLKSHGTWTLLLLLLLRVQYECVLLTFLFPPPPKVVHFSC